MQPKKNHVEAQEVLARQFRLNAGDGQLDLSLCYLLCDLTANEGVLLILSNLGHFDNYIFYGFRVAHVF